MNDDALEPVLNEKNELCWLTRKYETKSIENKPVKEAIQDNTPLQKIPVFSLQQQGLWECTKCGCLLRSAPDPPLECYQDQGGCDRSSSFRPIREVINPDIWKIPKWEDLEVNPKELYKEMLTLIKRLIVFSEEMEYEIFTLWIMSTWKLEAWDAVGFPCFIGLPNSGKSQALLIIHNLAYRASKTSGVKAAAVPRLCEYYNVTLLIDEAHRKLNPRHETGAELLDFVKDSYRQGSIYIKCDSNDEKKLIITKNYGFKAFAGEKTFDPALLTRSFVFWMDKADPEIAKFSYVEKELSEVRTKLLNYRYKKDNPPDLGNDFILKGRTREIFESIIRTAKHIGIPIDPLIEYAKARDKKEEDEEKNTIQYEVISIIKEFEDDVKFHKDPDKISLKELLTALEWEGDPEKTKSLGWILKNLGIVTTRYNKQRYVIFEDNKKRFKRLYRRYKLNEPQKTLNATADAVQK